MFKSIFIKEYLKLKWSFFFLFLAEFVVLVHFTFKLYFSFSSIEPESMMWYQWIQLQQKPYFYLSYFYVAIGVIIALIQFLLEMIKNRIKISVHLPLDMRTIMGFHLLCGWFFVITLTAFFSMALVNIIGYYYPNDVLVVTLKDSLAYSFASIVSYTIMASVLVEKNRKKQFFKALLLILFIFLFIKEEYSRIDFFWILIFIIAPFLLLDSFYSIKQQTLKKGFQPIMILVFLTQLGLMYSYYVQHYKKEFNRYYIFYSPLLNDFVYQKNFGNHQFEYGVNHKTTFTQKEYQSTLPFVYWKDLDIQNQLPITIHGKVFEKETIKESRLSFNYTPKMLKPLEIELYPLFNPKKNEGVIPFSEEFFTITKQKVNVYDYDQKRNKLEDDLNLHLKENHFHFPAKKIWGKTTNLKPFDLGYLILDAQNSLFHLKRANDTLFVKKIPYPNHIELAYINLSENRQKRLSGYAIDIQNNFYLLDWDFNFIKLKLSSFNHTTMKLKLLADPLYYLIQYDDGTNYYAELYSKQTYEKIDEIKFDN